MVHVSAHDFSPAVVLEAWDETPSLRGLRIELGAGGGRHSLPGQVVKLRSPSGAHRDGYFALANAPRGDGQGELLLKRGGGGLADELIAAARVGAHLPCSAPHGQGFPVAEAHGRDVLLFAAGSGITPVRALLQYLLVQRDPDGHLALYYGQRADDDFAYVGEHDQWRSAGVHLVLCASQPSHGWNGARGYVQVVARELELHRISTHNAVAFLCGMPSMVEAVRAELSLFGLPPTRTFLNL
jgi:NAD(P)H-flavin reductase